MTFSVTTPPASEPLDLAMVKLHLRVDTDMTDDDPLIESLMSAAREHVETVCERALITQTWTAQLAAFPPVIELRGGKVTAVDSVKYLDNDGALQTLDASAYVADLTTEPATIAPAFGTQWPVTRTINNAVQVQYKVGYADAGAVPAAIKSAMLLLIGDWYVNRTAQQDAELYSNRAADALLFPYRRVMP